MESLVESVELLLVVEYDDGFILQPHTITS